MKDSARIVQELIKYIPRLILERLEKDTNPIKNSFSESYQCAFMFLDIVEFSTLTEKVVSHYEKGLELIANILSRYFEQLIRVVINADGDIVKFAGDSLFVVWKVENGDPKKLAEAVYTATLCGIEIQKRLFHFPVEEGIFLSVRVGISAGKINAMHVGGAFDRWEFVITGEALASAAKAQKLAKPGEVVLSKRAWKLLEEYQYGFRVENKFKLNVPILEKRLKILSQNPFHEYNLSDKALPIMRNYVPRAIITRIEDGFDSWHTDFLNVTILFIRVGSNRMKVLSKIDKVQEIMKTIQYCIYDQEGSINRFGVDDKGVILLTAFGLPPLIHPNDPERAILASLLIQEKLNAIGYESKMGIATGKVFCGTVGNEIRSEYTMHGTSVNFAARLMQVSDGIVCDETTYLLTRELFRFEAKPPRKFKGKLELVPYYKVLGKA
ncbi:MAG: adenylate/guanylate cyclase domain-containing protein [Leptospiraceae bacterium]|nr:adenylate/guanylate cyclase domain-containing protein [Leptospiraceae bacterium]MDW7975052.1 adenylate/guanylate cyclase domain-containing protein [Leptospiraceae bacterium]